MLSVLDRHVKLWHVVLADGVALAWFAGMSLATQRALPGAKLFRCPIGLCPGYYSPNELNTTLTKIGKNGRDFFANTLLPLDMVLPALLLLAFTVTYLWLSQQGHAVSIPLSAGARRMLLAVPVLYCLIDYAENWTLVEALQAYPNIPYRLARRASILTATKSQLIVASVGIGLALLIAAWGRTRSHGGGRG
jgi:hypothetical protein